MRNDLLKRAVQSAIVATMASAVVVPSVYAQDQEDTIEEVVVTGSRIQRPDLDSVSPFSVVSGDEFRISGNINVEQKLAELPNTLPSFGPSSTNPCDGTARVDLRGLGTSRTLVLVNGRRYIPSTQAGVVDLNTIPGTLIKQVDVLTGGASAVYGSDALAGVVNFQLVDDFEGAEITGIYDITTEGDAEKWNTDITIGGNFADGRGNAVIYASYADRKSLFQGDRDFSTFALTEGDGELIPGGSSGIPGTRVFGGPTIDPDGIADSGDEFFLGRFLQNGSGATFTGADRFNYAPDNFLQLPQERTLLASFAHFDINDKAQLYSELTFARNDVPQELAPTPAFVGSLEVNPNSAFFGADVQAAFDAGRSDTNGDGVVDGSDNFIIPFIGRRMVENGSRQSIDTRDAVRFVAGVKGDLNDNWNYDAYFSRSTLDQSNLLNNDVSESRFRQAILVNDAGTACQDPSGGCAPLNIFGEGNISQAAIDFINVGASNVTKIKQEVVQASVSGATPWSITGGAPISAVFGFEHRRDSSSFRPDEFLAGGDVLGFNAGQATVGSFGVNELFTEVNIPLIEGKPYAESLDLWFAGRNSNYTTRVSSVDSFASALNWSVNDNVKFRVGYQQAVRAPNVAELFLGQSNGFPGYADPCSLSNQSATTDTAQCIADGVDLATFEQANTQVEASFGGNDRLTEEQSDTFTVGVVIEPIDNLDITLDYYNIEIDDAIGVFGANNLTQLCYRDDPEVMATPDLRAFACSQITRRGDGNINLITNTNVNTGGVTTSGIDLNVNYGIDLGGSELDLEFKSTFLDEFDVVPFDTGPTQACAGTFGNTCGSPRPEVTWNTRATWSTGPWTVSGLVRYIGETTDDQVIVGGADASTLVVPEIDAEFYLDLSAKYDFSDAFAVTMGINNILDTEPTPLGDSQEQANTFPSTYELFGPRAFVSASYKFF